MDNVAAKKAGQIAEDTLSLLNGRVDKGLAAKFPGPAESVLGEDDYPEALLQSARMMASLEPLADTPEIQAVLDQYSSARQNQPAQKSPRRWFGIAIAASLMLAVGTALSVLFYHPATDNNVARYITRIGEQKTVTLEDGSQLTLNTGTSLLVEMSPSRRRVTLDRGEVFFDVAGDPSRPFTISLGERAISVLGTSFNLYKSPDKFTLSVIEGVVSIHGQEDSASTDSPLLISEKDERVRLQSNGQRKVLPGTVAEYDYSNHLLIAYRDKQVEKRQAWRSGMLVFEDVPLGEVIQELNRYSSRKILFESSALMERKVYAVIDVRQLSVALEGLKDSVPIKIVTHFDRVVITDKK